MILGNVEIVQELEHPFLSCIIVAGNVGGRSERLVTNCGTSSATTPTTTISKTRKATAMARPRLMRGWGFFLSSALALTRSKNLTIGFKINASTKP